MKKLLENRIGESKTFDLENQYRLEKQTPISEMLDFLIEAKENGATHIELDIEKDYDGYIESMEVIPKVIYEESDEQMNDRLEKEKSANEYYKQLELERERQQYIQLKRKFESNL